MVGHEGDTATIFFFFESNPTPKLTPILKTLKFLISCSETFLEIVDDFLYNFQ